MFNHQKNEPFGLIKCPCCVTVECNSVNSNSKFLWGVQHILILKSSQFKVS